MTTKAKLELDPILKVPVYGQEMLDSFKVKAIQVSPPASDLETGIFRSSLSPTELVSGFPSIKTVYELFTHSVIHFGKNDFMGTRYPSNGKDGNTVWGPFVFKSYEQVNNDRIAFGAGLMKLHDDFVGDVGDWFLGIFSVSKFSYLDQ